VIERDKDNAFYVYRLVDRSTGKVVVELPRDQVSDLATSPSYEAGAVVSTKA
jgi:flagellar protein FlaG